MLFYNKRFIFLFISYKTDGRVSFHLDRFVLSSLAVVFKRFKKRPALGLSYGFVLLLNQNYDTW